MFHSTRATERLSRARSPEVPAGPRKVPALVPAFLDAHVREAEGTRFLGWRGRTGPGASKNYRGEGRRWVVFHQHPTYLNPFAPSGQKIARDVPAGSRKVPAFLDAHVREAEDSHYCGLRRLRGAPARQAKARGPGAGLTLVPRPNARRALGGLKTAEAREWIGPGGDWAPPE